MCGPSKPRDTCTWVAYPSHGAVQVQRHNYSSDATGKPLIREEFTDYADSAQLVSRRALYTCRHMHMGGIILLMGQADQFKCKA